MHIEFMPYISLFLQVFTAMKQTRPLGPRKIFHQCNQRKHYLRAKTLCAKTLHAKTLCAKTLRAKTLRVKTLRAKTLPKKKFPEKLRKMGFLQKQSKPKPNRKATPIFLQQFFHDRLPIS